MSFRSLDIFNRAHRTEHAKYSIFRFGYGLIYGEVNLVRVRKSKWRESCYRSGRIIDSQSTRLRHILTLTVFRNLLSLSEEGNVV